MAKIKLGSTPKNFKRKISFPLVAGGMGDINVVLKWRSRKEYFEFIDEINPGMKEQTEVAEPGAGVDVVEISEKAIDSDAAFLAGAVEEWDLDDELNDINLRKLVIDYPAASKGIVTAYREACVEGKGKNS